MVWKLGAQLLLPPPWRRPLACWRFSLAAPGPDLHVIGFPNSSSTGAGDFLCAPLQELVEGHTPSILHVRPRLRQAAALARQCLATEEADLQEEEGTTIQEVADGRALGRIRAPSSLLQRMNTRRRKRTTATTSQTSGAQTADAPGDCFCLYPKSFLNIVSSLVHNLLARSAPCNNKYII